MNIIRRSLIIMFLVCSIGSFFEYFNTIFLGLRYICMASLFLLFLLEIRKNFILKKHIFILLLFVLTFFIYPLVGILFNIYLYGLITILMNICFYISFLVCCLYISQYYLETSRANFFKDFSMICFLFLISGALIYRDFTIDVITLVFNLVSNNRIERSYLGFTNPNQVAIMSSVLIITTYLSNMKKITKIILLGFSLLILINTGARTPLLAMLLMVVFFIFYYSYKKITIPLLKVMLKTLLIGCTIVSILIFANFISTVSSSFFVSLDILTTNRLSRQLNTIKFLLDSRSFIFGLGMFNISFFSSQDIFSGLNTDSYYTYCLATTGIIGLVLNLYLVGNMLIKSLKMKNMSLIGIIIFCISYAAFEATLIFPTSLLSILLFVSYFILIDKVG